MADHSATLRMQLTHLACCVAALISGLPFAGAETLRLSGSTMGTYYSIVIDGASESDRERITAAVETRLEEINRQMSTWREDSEITRFNRDATEEWFPVSRDFAVVVTESLRIHEMTGGLFDPTVGPLVDLWGFGAKRPLKFPRKDEIEAARARTGMRHIEVRDDPPALRRTKPGVELNLSAIAKGLGVDRLSELLTTLGFQSHIVDVGGENRAGARKTDGGHWRVGVESPVPNDSGLHRVLQLSEESVATSGDYRNHFERDGIRYCHILDPTTGYPVKNPAASVTVLHRSCMTADALATALMVMGVERGIEFAGQQGLSVMFLSVSGQPSETVQESSTGKLRSAAVDEPGVSKGNVLIPVFLTIGVFLLAVTGMAVGVIFRNRALKGSCGGLAAMSGEHGSTPCQLCTVPKDQCARPEVREKFRTEIADRHDAEEPIESGNTVS